MKREKADALVIGSGMGGMCVAARLTAHGRKVILVEKSPYLGGRCSSRQRDDFTVTTGAIMIPMGENSAIRQAFDAVNAPMDMVDTTGRMRYRLPHGDYDIPQGGGGLPGMIDFALEGDTEASQQLFQQFTIALTGWMPLNSISIKDWLEQHTDNRNVLGIFQGFCAALMGTNLHEIPAGEFFRFLKYSSRGSRFGLAARGNAAMMESLARAMKQRGAVIHTQTRCGQILVNRGVARGAIIHTPDGEELHVEADYVISNTGPDRTVELAGGEAFFEQSYLAELQRTGPEAPIIHLSFVTDQPLIEGFDGCLIFGNTKNLIYLEIPSLISPALSPNGKFLHTAYGAPSDAAKPELKAETKNALCELEDNFPGVTEQAKFLVKAKHSGQAPGMHRWLGSMMPVDTPIRNLFNVGDGCASPGNIGTEGAASSAKVVVESIVAG